MKQTESLTSAYYTTAQHIAYGATVNEEERSLGLAHLHDVIEAATIVSCTGDPVRPVDLARRVRQAIGSLPAVEDAVHIYRALRAERVLPAADNKSNTTTPSDVLIEQLWTLVSDKPLPGRGNIRPDQVETFVDAMNDALAADPLAVLSSQRRRCAVEISKRVVDGPHDILLGILLGVLYLRLVERNDLIPHLEALPSASMWRYANQAPRKRALKEGVIDPSVDHARQVDNAWRETKRRIETAAAHRRAKATISSLSPFAAEAITFHCRDLEVPLGCSRRTAFRIADDLVKRGVLAKYADPLKDTLLVPVPLVRVLHAY